MKIESRYYDTNYYIVIGLFENDTIVNFDCRIEEELPEGIKACYKEFDHSHLTLKETIEKAYEILDDLHN